MGIRERMERGERIFCPSISRKGAKTVEDPPQVKVGGGAALEKGEEKSLNPACGHVQQTLGRERR